MTRKDFEALAGVVRREFIHNSAMLSQGVIDLNSKVERDVALAGVRRGLIEIAKASNPRFDEARFIKATEI